MTQKKLGNLVNLSQFSGIAAPEPEPQQTSNRVRTLNPQHRRADKPVTINIKIARSQKEWLSDTASLIRDNNLDPVPPALRVYPQHLIGVAIDLLETADVDWSQIKNIDNLREVLNLPCITAET